MDTDLILENAAKSADYTAYEHFKAQLAREGLPEDQYQRELRRLTQIMGI